MFLVELRPGKEELYRSSDELALAIRNGDVDARSRVYHRATAKWISITLHPQYKAIVSAAKEDSGGRPARRGWNILGGSNDGTGQAPRAESTANGGPLMHRWRRPLALGISGLLLMSGVQLAFSGPRPPWANRSHSAAVAIKKAEKPNTPASNATARPEMAAPSRLISLVSTEIAWPEETAAVDTSLSAPSIERAVPVLPRAPRLRTKSLREALTPTATKAAAANSLEAVFARYTAAHDSARTRLESGMRVARLTRLFAASRLGPDGGVTDTRMSLAGAANFIRVYRQQQAAIEQAYQDTVTAMARQQAWSPRKVRAWYARSPRKEAPTLELLSGSLLSTIDSVLGVLAEQAGAYKIRGTAIAFEDPTAGQRYGALRRRVKEQIDAAVAAGGATTPGPASLLLQAIGTTSLPRET
jgi:hypothetical protein